MFPYIQDVQDPLESPLPACLRILASGDDKASPWMTSAGDMDPVSAALDRYRDIDTYQVTLISTAYERTDVIRYSYKSPGYVRMDILAPHKGAVLTFHPQTRKVRLWPAGLRFLALTLDPGNRLVRSRTGHRVDRSDIGALLENVRALQKDGETRIIRTQDDGQDMLLIAVTGDDDVHPPVHRYNLYLDRATLLPVKVASLDRDDRPIEHVVFEGMQVNPELPDAFFNP